MAERPEEPQAEPPDASSSGPGGVAAAMTAGLRRRRSGAKDDPEFDAFLRQQTRLSELQTEHLHEQREVILSRLRLGRWKDRVTLGLQALTGLVGLAIAAAVGIMAWQAHEDHGVTIEAFSVPPDLAQRGLTGQVVASRLLGRLADLQAKTVSSRPASSYTNNWGDDIKVEIPETGVSIGELNRYLIDWLGSETRITGDVVRTSTGIAVTAQVGASLGNTFQGTDADLPRLIQDAAESVFAETQPYRYAVYLASTSRANDAVNIYQRLARSGDGADRAWAYAGWATLLFGNGDLRGAVDKAEASLSLDPRLYPARLMLSISLDSLGRDQDELVATRRERALLGNGGLVGLSQAANATRQHFLQGVDASLVGDYGGAASLLRGFAGASMDFEGRGQAYDPDNFLAAILAWDHDVSASRRFTNAARGAGVPALLQSAALDDWASVALRWRQLPGVGVGDAKMTRLASYGAVALAHLGRFPEAETLAAQIPLDCDRCLVARAVVAALKHDWPAADGWFAVASKRAPSLPFAPTEWGRALLAKGDIDGAIEKVSQAHRIGPRYADPLEVWGEALMAKGDYTGAIPNFAEADKDAPKWGRNHLRWGEALMFSGRYADARAQYQIANGLDLSKPDRAALNVLLARTATRQLHA